MSEIKIKFVVKNNLGKVELSKSYVWNKEDGLPNEEKILEDIETCNCLLSEDSFCEGGCINFDEGEAIDIIRSTGLKDKNGKEIYEEYILKDDFGIVYLIFWNNQLAQFDVMTKQEISSDVKIPIGNLEIIGNKLENPELLEAKE